MDDNVYVCVCVECVNLFVLFVLVGEKIESLGWLCIVVDDLRLLYGYKQKRFRKENGRLLWNV